MTRLLAAVLLSVLALIGPACGQEDGAARREQEVILGLLGQAPVEENQFTPEFLAQVPLAQVEQLLVQIKSTIGTPEEVRPTEDGYVVETRTHTMPVQITLDEAGRISSLLFRPPVQSNASIADIAAQFDDLEGTVSYLVVRDGEVLAERDADTPLAVGSAFKLAVLALLDEAIERGEHSWDDVVRLENRHISLPTGLMQTFPVGSPVTLHTAAALMISISDNTATDLLIDVVGREALAEKLGVDFALTTREFFFLKGDLETRDAFLAASPEGKLEITEDMAGRPMPALNPNLPLHDEGVEWYVSARRLCELIDAVAHLDVMSINSGIATASDWRRVAYKGGSETGVLNFTTQLTARDGSEICAVLTINNDSAVTGTTPTSVYASILAALAPRQP
ncbi:serine hydrolase [Devosia nitrariae]|uniref:Serine hydrolase n=1 Tax=Devosia nitrariae TaxID=2071872 RepID=A0ABQ5W7Y3_9HYPH|nr:serine hydrolase [Devosia nitrariae]GLQ55998.1 serine hydrolase [Devosia nitrariae]